MSELSAVIEDFIIDLENYLKQIPIQITEATFGHIAYDKDFHGELDGEYYEFDERDILVNNCRTPKDYKFSLLEKQNDYIIKTKMRLRSGVERKQLAKLILKFKEENYNKLIRNFKYSDKDKKGYKIKDAISVLYEIEKININQKHLLFFYYSDLKPYYECEKDLLDNLIVSLDRDYSSTITEVYKYNSINLKNHELHIKELDELYFFLIDFEIITYVGEGKGITQFRNLFNNTPVKSKFIWNRSVSSFSYFINQIYMRNETRDLLKNYHNKWEVGLNCFKVYKFDKKEITHQMIPITLHKTAPKIDERYSEDLKYHLEKISNKNKRFTSMKESISKKVRKEMR